MRKSASQSALAKRMETHIDVAGTFIEIALCWSVVDRAKSAGLDETIDPHLFLD